MNNKLSPPEVGDDTDLHCGSLADLQAFWSSNEPGNVMNFADRYRYAVLNSNVTPSLSTGNLQRTWTKAISTRGCNSFLHKMALFLTNYHASISVHKTRAGLIRDYYDNILAGLQNGANFVELMTIAATDAALARAYGHQYSRYRDSTDTFYGTDDFAREFHQLLFRIQGVTEDPDYHEDTTIEHSAWMLAGMDLDRNVGAYDSANSGDWYIGPLDFSDHYDLYTTPRYVDNFTNHYHADLGANSCLEILHEQICGANAGEKIAALAQVAGAHPESMENVPVSIIDFFADDNLARPRLMRFAVPGQQPISIFWRSCADTQHQQFHSADTFKYITAFDRNLTIQNANTLDNEEVFGRQYYDSPLGRMAGQGAKCLSRHSMCWRAHRFRMRRTIPTFLEVATHPMSEVPISCTTSRVGLHLEDPAATTFAWTKDWDSVVPANANGDYVVAEVAEWLWNHFIGDGGKNFDPIARAQVHALLASDRDFAYTVDSRNNGRPFTPLSRYSMTRW